jgi:hypothetical protein
MRRYAGLLAIAGALLFVSTAQAAAPAGAGSFVLTANSPGGTYAPTFTATGCSTSAYRRPARATPRRRRGAV